MYIHIYNNNIDNNNNNNNFTLICKNSLNSKLYEIESGNFKVYITPIEHNSVKFYKLANKFPVEGFGNILMPTITNYCVHIEVPDNYNKVFTVENFSIGDQKINIKNTYYKNSIVINGFEENTNKSFMFYSPSDIEKYNDNINYNQSNIINITLIEYEIVNNNNNNNNNYI